MKTDMAFTTTAGLVCAGTALAGALASSLPVMGIALVGGIAATAAALSDKGQPSVAQSDSAHHRHVNGHKANERQPTV